MQLKDGLCLNRFYCCNGEKIFSAVGTHHSDETRKKISEALQGHPSPRRIKISIGDNIFESIKEAAKYHNVSTTTIRRWVKKNQHNAFYVEKCPKI